MGNPLCLSPLALLPPLPQVSYTRKAFGQTGDGHFSPIGGYHGGRDLVLILDTVRACSLCVFGSLGEGECARSSHCVPRQGED